MSEEDISFQELSFPMQRKRDLSLPVFILMRTLPTPYMSIRLLRDICRKSTPAFPSMKCRNCPMTRISYLRISMRFPHYLKWRRRAGKGRKKREYSPSIQKSWTRSQRLRPVIRLPRSGFIKMCWMRKMPQGSRYSMRILWI